MKRTCLFLLLCTLFLNVKAQWECPSKLAANLDPVFNSPLLLGSEFQLSTGILDGSSINTAMAFAGLDYSTKNHSFYIEGGFKAWGKYDFDQEVLFDQYRFGLRELFYQYSGNVSSFSLGLQTSTLDDHYLLNERIAGANFKLDLGKWKLNVYGGSVTKDFARNGIFCTTGFIYDLSTGQDQVLLGNNLGDKNLAAFTFSFFPQKERKGKAVTTESDTDGIEVFDEFESTDEFGTFEETTSESPSKNPKISLENFGLVAYSEFGDWITNTFYHAGLFASIKLPGEIYFNPEALFQIENSNKGIIYLVKLEKSFSLKNGNRLSLNAAYYGFSEIDENAMVLNSYSNILAGEVIRLDAVNMPLYLVGAKLTLPSNKIHVKLQHAGQAGSGDLKEVDLEIGKQFKRFQLNAKGGIINGGDLTEKALLGRLEARFYF
ncbi:hypothetical protein SLH46_15700 [Draconibacterium sp. IB214405]|uniref:hypothetical protein n=1 Tax=Draconibacterium sp. IB214405 TaxID=3097352 RepID=UPI002A17787F|nr:hypothetical protein [Draconibacterium sp. IB214405]MDX8340642.1 hypothetical protein [Draconibacterium sp. IB214405]